MTDNASPSGTTEKNFLRNAKVLIAKKHAAGDHSRCGRDCDVKHPRKTAPPSAPRGVAHGTTPYGAKALQEEYDLLRTTATGGRNDQLFKTATRLFSLVAGGEIGSESEVEQALRDACMENRYLVEEPRGFDKTTESAKKTGLANPSAAPNKPLVEPLTGQDPLAAPALPAPQSAEEPEVAAPAGSVLPEGFWESRDYLRHIRQAAWSRGRSAEATLGAVLARVAADMDYAVKIPPVVGSPCGLSLLVALVGRSGDGKSTSASIARELRSARVNLTDECDGVPPGSGEGLIELLFSTETEIDPYTEKQTKVKRQTRYNCYVYVDEGEILSQQSRRNNTSTFWSVVRSIFTDGLVGQANASEERKRILPPGQYVYGIVMGIQWTKTQALFDDAAGGTPQRLVWMAANTPRPDPDNRPDWPDDFEWKPRPSFKVDPFGDNWKYLVIPDEIKKEIEWNDYERSEGRGNELDSHADLVRLKVAAILAILDGRGDVDKEDWRLAEMVMTASNATRDHALRYLEMERRERMLTSGRYQAGVQEVIEEERYKRLEAAMEAAMKTAWKKLRKHQDEDRHQGKPCQRKCLITAMSGPQRTKIKDLGGVDGAVENLIDMQWIIKNGDGFLIGPSQPRGF